ncbi:MAG: ABC transporter substrate-binding protein [Candidatus Tectimicrobiota bacterium]|nr:MAG: ABC transporter substrate-binding protein [Candidatus Tectomicrobia bacterium]
MAPHHLVDLWDFDPRDPMLGLTAAELSGPPMSRRAVLRLLAATGLLGLAASLPPPLAAAGRGGHLKAGWNLDQFAILDPAFINVTEQMQAAANIFSGLVHIDAALTPQPELAERWEVSADGRQWTFQLRRGVRFHDGAPFSADDVLFTYQRTNDPKVGSIHRPRLANIEAVTKLGAYEVQFTLKSPSAAFLIATLSRFPARAMTIVSRTALEKMGPQQYKVTPVGTGPFRVKEHIVGQRLVLERFPDYFIEGKPKLDMVTIVPVPEAETAVAALRTGEVQFLNNVQAQFLPLLEADPGVTVLQGPDPGFQALILNQKTVLAFRDRRVRLAIAKAIDRETLAKRGYFGRVQPDTGPIPAAQKLYWRPEKLTTSPQAYDPEAAKRLWQEAGVGSLKVKLLTSVVRGNLRGAQVLKPLLEQVLPITLDIEQVDPSVYFKRQVAGDFETLLGGSGADLDPNDSIRDFFPTGAKFNSFGYSNPEVDALVEQQFRELDVQKRIALVHRAEDLIMADAPMAFTHHLIEYLAMRKEVKGFVFAPTPAWDLSEVWLA